MLFNKTSFIGIDPSAGKRPFVYAALDRELRLVRLDSGTMDEVLAFVAGQEEAIVAVNSPQRRNQGLMMSDELRATLSPSPRSGRYTGYRVAEYLLVQQGISIPRTPGANERCPGWMRMGFEIYQRLTGLGYHTFPAGKELRQVMEVYPHGMFTRMLSRPPFPKYTLEGRIQRQLVLYLLNIYIPDPMQIFEEVTRHRILQSALPLDGLYEAAELDALAAAYMAWLGATRPERITMVGLPEDG